MCDLGLETVPIAIMGAFGYEDYAIDRENLHLLEVAQGVVDARARAVVGPTSSDEVAAILPMMEAAGILVLSQSATSAGLAGASPNFFRTVPSDAVQGPSQASWTLTVLKAKTALVLYQDNS